MAALVLQPVPHKYIVNIDIGQCTADIQSYNIFRSYDAIIVCSAIVVQHSNVQNRIQYVPALVGRMLYFFDTKDNRNEAISNNSKEFWSFGCKLKKLQD